MRWTSLQSPNGCRGSNNLATGGRTQILLRRNVFPAANQRASPNFTPNWLPLGIRLKESTFCELCRSRNRDPRPETANGYFKGRGKLVQDSAPQSRMNIGANSACLTQMISKRNLISTSCGPPGGIVPTRLSLCRPSNMWRSGSGTLVEARREKRTGLGPAPSIQSLT